MRGNVSNLQVGTLTLQACALYSTPNLPLQRKIRGTLYFCVCGRRWCMHCQRGGFFLQSGFQHFWQRILTRWDRELDDLAPFRKKDMEHHCQEPHLHFLQHWRQVLEYHHSGIQDDMLIHDTDTWGCFSSFCCCSQISSVEVAVITTVFQ